MTAVQLNAMHTQLSEPTLMTKEEFFARVDESRKEIKQGKYTVLLPDEDLATHLRRHGYDI